MNESDIIDLEQRVTYIEKDGTEREYLAKGDRDRIEIVMPDTQRIDVNYAKDSISDYNYSTVIVGVSSDTGTLIIPKTTLELISEYGYGASVSDGEHHVILSKEIIANLNETGGEAVLKIEVATPDKMTREQSFIVGYNYAVSVTLTLNGEAVTQLGGMAEITVEPGFQAAHVYYVSPNGALEEIESEYDSETGSVLFSVEHFSIYMITLDRSPNYIDPPLILALAFILMFSPYAYVRWRERDDV